MVDHRSWRAAGKCETAARRFLAREGREIRWTAARPTDLWRGRRPNIPSPQYNSPVWRTTSKIQLFRMVDARAVAPPHELRGSARSLTKNLRAHHHVRSRSSEQGVDTRV